MGDFEFRIFELSGVPFDPQDMQNAVPQYSWEDLRPYVPTPEQEDKYIQGLRPYSIFQERPLDERPLDERFADFKVRLAAALKKRGIS